MVSKVESGSPAESAGFELGDLHHVVGGVTPHALGGFNDFEGHAGRGFDRNGFALDKENFTNHIGRKKLLHILNQFWGKSKVFVIFGIHKGVTRVVVVAELPLIPGHIDRFEALVGGEAMVGGLARTKGTEHGLDESAFISRGSVRDPHDDVDVPVFADGHSLF